MVSAKRAGLVVLFVCLICLPSTVLAQDRFATAEFESWDESKDGPLPHFPLGRLVDRAPSSSLQPYALSLNTLMPPQSGVIASPTEYHPAEGVILRYSSYTWSQVTSDIVAAITGDPTHDDKAYVVLDGPTQQGLATTQFTAAGADMSKVVFMEMPSDAIWLRDYGPAFIWHDETRAITDQNYYMTNRTKDNFTPTLIGEDYLEIPVYPMGLGSSAGGNFLPGPNRSAFVSEVIFPYNPGFTQAYLESLYQDYLGIDTLHILPDLPSGVDLTGHIDMWLYLIDDDTVIISEFVPGSDPTAIQITENAVLYMENLGFEVFRVKDQVGTHPSWPGAPCHYTYTNCFRINDRILISSFGSGDPAFIQSDADALAVFQAAAPDCEIIQINSYEIIWAAGALHCISMLVPKRVAESPAAKVLSPDGNELLVSGSTQTLRWGATDNEAVTAVDLHYSLDGGATFPHLIASGLANDSEEAWTVPYLSGAGDQAVLKVTAHDASQSGTDESNALFQIRSAVQHPYDFSSEAGVNRWGYGNLITQWSELDGIRIPATFQTIDNFDRKAYERLAVSDAAGDQNDPNRYRSATPYGGWSAHIFEFTIEEDPALMLDLAVLWEGYGENCGQMELYLWDEVGGNWSDGQGGLGENQYLAIYAGNRDDQLISHIRADFDRYLDASNRLALLVISDYEVKRTYHDYLSVTVTYEALTADTHEVSITTGGTINLSLDAGQENHGRTYLILGSLSGTSPGLPLPSGGVNLPLNWDGFTDLVLRKLNTGVFTNFLGVLDGTGKASAQINAPTVAPEKLGKVMHFAFLLEGSPWDFASNPVGVEFIN